MTEKNVLRKKAVNGISFLLPVLPVLLFFSHNINQFNELIFTPEVLILFLIYSCISFLLFFLLNKIFRYTTTQSLFLSDTIVIGFLFFGAIQDVLLHLKKIRFISNSFFLFFLIVTVIVFFFIIIKRRKYDTGKANLFLLLLFSILICYEGVLFSITLIKGKSLRTIAHRMTSAIPLSREDSAQSKPDIYHIVFDSYSNRTELKESWNYENEIYPFLESKGFYTVDSAKSNYKYTAFSISSIFSYQYLKGADPYLFHTSSNFLIGQQAYNDNLLFDFLKKEGYQFSNFSLFESEKILTSFGFLGVEKPANWLRKLTMERIYLNPWIINKITKFFRGNKQQPAVIKRSMKRIRDYNTDAIKHMFELCNKRTSKETSPQFSYTHFMIPHDPYQVDKNGDHIPFSEPSTYDMNGYLEQLKYCNKLIKEITECILSNTERETIIIIQGDHGYRYYTNATVDKKFCALNAFYFPNRDYSGLEKTTSHVNTYRLVLNKFFGTNLPLLKDTLIGADK